MSLFVCIERGEYYGRRYFLGYVVANKFSMDPDKRQKIFSQCKKEGDSLEQRKQEILEKYANKQDKPKSRKK